MNNVALNQQTDDEQSGEESVADNVVAIGSLLSQAREALGVSLERVADELKIPESKLHALETEQYEKLASPTFVKGYLRTYSRYLNLNVDDIVRRYDHISGDSETAAPEAKPVSRLEPIEKPFPELRWPLAIGAVVLLLIAGYILWGDNLRAWAFGAPSDEAVIETTDSSVGANTQSTVDEVVVDPLVANASSVPSSVDALDSVDSLDSAPDSAQFDNQQLSNNQVSSNQNNQAITENSDSGARLVDGSAESVGSSDNSLESPVIASDTVNVISNESQVSVAATTETLPANTAFTSSQDTLTFSFTGDCWLEVRDANGDVLVSRVANSGQSVEVNGQSPFAIRLGNARVVSLLHNGETVAINPIAGRNTLRLQVGQ
ncbi:helix-turn-helix domain-containing protein [Sessilibacter corallicola]|uniref:helix-turn-helix domain-containing protein n=1 Tax=Sessilibacter corallicola TaxID=2904075 RepID=UPI001E4E5424|nr:RodZ family helix-turn-helix domain-containing protein [Sessilibacter corallicola]MCE2029354.1 helix-turn-helix domain-containing protein [Sessilibacter corallicola]